MTPSVSSRSPLRMCYDSFGPLRPRNLTQPARQCNRPAGTLWDHFAGKLPVFPATLFDYNGVLANDETVHLAAFQDTLAALGIALSAADYWQKYLGFDDVGAFQAILHDAGKPADSGLIASLVETKRPLYRARAEASLPLF